VPVVEVEITGPIVVSARTAVQMPGSRMPDFGGGGALVDQPCIITQLDRVRNLTCAICAPTLAELVECVLRRFW
jgi:hypothetical protein